MLKGARILLRPVRDEDWQIIEAGPTSGKRYGDPNVTALTDTENVPAQRVLESAGFRREGVWRRATFRVERWCDLALYGRLRSYDDYVLE